MIYGFLQIKPAALFLLLVQTSPICAAMVESLQLVKLFSCNHFAASLLLAKDCKKLLFLSYIKTGFPNLSLLTYSADLIEILRNLRMVLTESCEMPIN